MEPHTLKPQAQWPLNWTCSHHVMDKIGTVTDLNCHFMTFILKGLKEI